MTGRKAIVWTAKSVAAVFIAAMLAACTPTGEDQNGVVDPKQDRGPYAPFLG